MCKGKNCKAVKGVGHSKGCVCEHDKAMADAFEGERVVEDSPITQELVDSTFITMSELWLDKFQESGHKLVASFVAENKDGWAVQFLAEYQMAKEVVEMHGIVMPVLVEGITIKLGESDEAC